MKNLAIKYEIDMTDYQPLDYQATEYEISTSWFGEVKLDRRLKTFDLEHLISVINRKKWYSPR
ncbi:hypothetical protein [Siphonobacter curvatus]|nr:hypothetical protein [Siphonobacter curvatus]